MAEKKSKTNVRTKVEALPHQPRHGALATFGIGKERDYFIENLSTLLASGMNITTALNAIKSGIRSSVLRSMIDEIREAVDSGSALWKALEASSLLPTHVTSLVRIGEETGRLSENLAVIVNQQRKDRVFRSRVRSAMLYPTLVFVIGLVVSVGISWFILPRLGLVFSSLHLELPLLTRIMIRVGTFVSHWGSIVIPSLLTAIGIGWYILFFFSPTKHIGQKLLFVIPGVGRLMQEVELARFGYILGTLLAAGLTVPKAMMSLKDATELNVYARFYEYVRVGVDEGNSFQKCFAAYSQTDRLIPPPIQQMLFAAEQSGNLSQTLLKIGETFEERAETTTKNLSVIVEPILLAIVWVGVVGVAMAVILPIYGIIGGLNK